MKLLMDFIHDTLDVIPQPAALYTLEGEFIGRNAVSSAHLIEVFGTEPTQEQVADLFQIPEIGEDLRQHPTTSRRHQDYLVLLSLVEPFPLSPRPTLVLGTMHRGVSEEMAYLDHGAVLALVKLNEAHQGAAMIIETTLLQLESVLSGQQRAVSAINQAARNRMRATYK